MSVMKVTMNDVTVSLFFVLMLPRKAYYSKTKHEDCKGDVAPHVVAT